MPRQRNRMAFPDLLDDEDSTHRQWRLFACPDALATSRETVAHHDDPEKTMTSMPRYVRLCLAALAAACGEEGSIPAAPDTISARPSASVAAITAPTLKLDAHSLYYCYGFGNRYCVVVKHQVRITSSGAPLKWSASTDKPWIAVSPASGTTPSTLTVSVNPGTVVPYLVPGHVTITATGASNSPQTILVEITPWPPPALAFSDSAIGFCYYPTSTRACVKLQEDVIISGTRGSALSWRAVSSVPWIVLHPLSGTTPTTVRMSVDLTKVQVRIGTSVSGLITVSSGAAANTPQRIPVKLQFYNWPLPR